MTPASSNPSPKRGLMHQYSRTACRTLRSLTLLLGLALGVAHPAFPNTPEPASPSEQRPTGASQVYEKARSQLVQIRTVLKGRASQASVGSGFFVSKGGHIITNFHVVSEAALGPDKYDLVYVTADGREAKAVLLMIDVRHDLALLKAGDAIGQSFDNLSFRPANEPLRQGERMVSLGNPLDVGFAVVEGLYNGLVERSFYPQIFFAGALSSGMSGGPALDQQGRIVGVNVAKRGDGEQISFLVPASFARDLLNRGLMAAPMVGPAYAEVGKQLLEHQEELTRRFINQGWKKATHPRYTLPVPVDRFMRCWGQNESSRSSGTEGERTECMMDSRVYAGAFVTGSIRTRHETLSGSELGALRFAALQTANFAHQSISGAPSQMTRPRCHEDYLDRNGLTLRAVVCLKAYKRMPKLFDVSILVATLDDSTAGVQARFDADGVSFDNAMKLTEHYLSAFGRLP